MTLCPGCKGAQRITSSGEQLVTCVTCKGFGQVSADHAWRIICGEKIKKWRKDHDLTRRKWASSLGIVESTLTNIENGSAPRIVYMTMMGRMGIEPPAPVRKKETA